MSPNPHSLGVPHDEWRGHQYETVKWIGQTHGTLIIQAPTGSGKSAVASALGHYGQVRCLTHTINLQQQYESIYDFEPLYGLRNYPCELIHGLTAGECVYSEAMYECPVKHDCEYLVRREIVSKAQRQSLGYAYFMVANWIWEHPTEFLYCDEAHLLPGIVKEYCTIEYTPQQLQFLQLPLYPQGHIRSEFARLRLSLNWLNSILLDMKVKYNKLMDIPREKRMKLPRVRNQIRKLTDDIRRLGRTISYANEHPNEFYVNWDENSFKLVPLTARLYFKDFFINQWPHKAILTSATIGNAETFARELGLNNFQFRDVPSNFPASSMPVFALKDAPKLSYRLSDSGWVKWAQTIADSIKDLNPAWSGIIHVSSKKQAERLADSLARMGLQDRVYIPSGSGTSGKIADWQKRKREIPNTLAVAYSFHMGLDAFDDEINIIGKIPFATLDEFGNALLRYDKDIYRYNAALLTEQAAGRIRRGRPEHYEESGQPMRKFVAIADANYIKVADQFSNHFNNCIVEQ